ncbi:response regulator [Gulosibacter sediminis]|uniref:response regulator n=1 Tax=Gulosibacter sediminis TaxID=1729695 RepID=UPI0024ACE9B2|nr:response regulator transcription factor [Gulosibacter sediminis]
MTIRVLIVDDQSLVREGLALIAGSVDDIEVVGKAENGREGVNLGLKLRPDVVLMDVRMPVMDGIEATERLLQHSGERPELRVLALTTYDSEDFAVRMLAAGASGFLLKDAPGEDLIRAIRTVAAGNAIIDPSMTRTLLHRLTTERPQQTAAADRDALVAHLTDRERDVLAQLVQGVSNAQIAKELFLAEVTVKTHVGRILDKLGLPDRVHVVIWAYESGYIDR